MTLTSQWKVYFLSQNLQLLHSEPLVCTSNMNSTFRKKCLYVFLPRVERQIQASSRLVKLLNYITVNTVLFCFGVFCCLDVENSLLVYWKMTTQSLLLDLSSLLLPYSF